MQDGYRNQLQVTSPVIEEINERTVGVQDAKCGAYTLRLTVTDNVGQQDSADVTIASTGDNTTAIVPLTANTHAP